MKAALLAIARRHARPSALAVRAVVSFLLISLFFSYFGDYQYNYSQQLPSPYNASLGFGRILLISLPSRTDRQDAMSLAFRLSGLNPAEYVPGVRGEDVANVAKPGGSANVTPANIGSWRAHANAWKRVVDEGWGTALILEDDTDWDIQIKSQLYLMSDALRRSRSHEDEFSDDYPYGQAWDFFSFGHCLETNFNKTEESHFIYPDPSVLPPEKQTETDRKVLTDFDVPDGHRVLSRAKNPICIMGYGVTQEGAQRMLYKFGLEWMAGPLDIEIMLACGEKSMQCLEVNPALIGVYREPGPVSKVSDIQAEADVNAHHRGDNPIGPGSIKSLLHKKFSNRPRG